MNLVEISGILLWICVRYTQGNDGCKLDAFHRCFQSKFMDISEPENVHSACLHQRSKTSQCMEKVKRECEAELRQTIDTAAWKDAVTLYCDNTHLFAANVNCTQRVKYFMRTCSTSGLTHFTEKMARRNITMTDPKTGMQLTCEYKEDTLDCVDSKLSRKCPENVRNVLVKVIRLFNKPACSFGPYVDTTMHPTTSTSSQREDTTNTGSRTTAAYIILSLVLVHLMS
ncbi:uncharacterized protein LOC124269239 [Haliotis rubra]|uniref:uncharacterized protein LOC124269239 n=1 Tax=Haliotis rubra TaxID=36100 RepID=UPI001EE52D50|nr:uncharacterized protein LOC124269239 [Haliotis rubra]